MDQTLYIWIYKTNKMSDTLRGGDMISLLQCTHEEPMEPDCHYIGHHTNKCLHSLGDFYSKLKLYSKSFRFH